MTLPPTINVVLVELARKRREREAALFRLWLNPPLDALLDHALERLNEEERG